MAGNELQPKDGGDIQGQPDSSQGKPPVGKSPASLTGDSGDSGITSGNLPQEDDGRFGRESERFPLSFTPESDFDFIPDDHPSGMASKKGPEQSEPRGGGSSKPPTKKEIGYHYTPYTPKEETDKDSPDLEKLLEDLRRRLRKYPKGFVPWDTGQNGKSEKVESNKDYVPVCDIPLALAAAVVVRDPEDKDSFEPHIELMLRWAQDRFGKPQNIGEFVREARQYAVVKNMTDYSDDLASFEQFLAKNPDIAKLDILDLDKIDLGSPNFHPFWVTSAKQIYNRILGARAEILKQTKDFEEQPLFFPFPESGYMPENRFSDYDEPLTFERRMAFFNAHLGSVKLDEKQMKEYRQKEEEGKNYSYVYQMQALVRQIPFASEKYQDNFYPPFFGRKTWRERNYFHSFLPESLWKSIYERVNPVFTHFGLHNPPLPTERRDLSRFVSARDFSFKPNDEFHDEISRHTAFAGYARASDEFKEFYDFMIPIPFIVQSARELTAGSIATNDRPFSTMAAWFQEQSRLLFNQQKNPDENLPPHFRETDRVLPFSDRRWASEYIYNMRPLVYVLFLNDRMDAQKRERNTNNPAYRLTLLLHKNKSRSRLLGDKTFTEILLGRMESDKYLHREGDGILHFAKGQDPHLNVREIAGLAGIIEEKEIEELGIILSDLALNRTDLQKHLYSQIRCFLPPATFRKAVITLFQENKLGLDQAAYFLLPQPLNPIYATFTQSQTSDPEQLLLVQLNHADLSKLNYLDPDYFNQKTTQFFLADDEIKGRIEELKRENRNYYGFLYAARTRDYSDVKNRMYHYDMRPSNLIAHKLAIEDELEFFQTLRSSRPTAVAKYFIRPFLASTIFLILREHGNDVVLENGDNKYAIASDEKGVAVATAKSKAYVDLKEVLDVLDRQIELKTIEPAQFEEILGKATQVLQEYENNMLNPKKPLVVQRSLLAASLETDFSFDGKETLMSIVEPMGKAPEIDVVRAKPQSKEDWSAILGQYNIDQLELLRASINIDSVNGDEVLTRLIKILRLPLERYSDSEKETLRETVDEIIKRKLESA